ncbi:MAG: DUF1761 domain-containing protein [Betaproteobacteria bacterium]
MGGVNHVAVWVAGIVHFMIGAGWYTAFGPAWLAAVGKTEAQIKSEQPNMAIPLVIAVVVAVIIAYALAWLLPKLGAQSAAAGANTGAVLALTLIASTLAMNYGFEARSISLWLINAGYMVVGIAVMGAIIGGWRKKA